MASTGLWAETQNVSYLYPVYNTDGDATSRIKEWKTASVDATVVENASEPVTWTAGWYVVTGTDVTLSQGAICSGNVNLILADGAKLTATGIDDVLNSTPGIQVSGDGNSLTIYGQTAQTGRLIATGKTYSAGIGGNGADGLRDGSNITINGGTVTANGGSQAAAIGGGLRGNGSNIIINGGTVTAKGSAAGIGGGNRGNGSNIIINGGTVTARGGDGSDGIGNGENPTTPSSNIFVATWCIVKAGSSLTPADVIENTGSDLATSLEGKRNVTVETPKFAVTYGDNITVSPAFASGAEIAAGTQITFTAADRTADSYGFWGFYEESTFDTPITTGVNNQAYTVTVTDAAISVYARFEKYASASYVYPVYNDPDDVTKGVKEDWETETVNAYVVTSSDTPVTLGEAGKKTWYVVTGKDVTLSQGAICYGNVNLILADDAKLTATGADDKAGITTAADLGNSLTIYGQTAQSGQLEANGGIHGAGIGGGNNCSCAEITINGGTVTANGGDGASGIGGGYNHSGSFITINGGTVTANGAMGAAGIGGGYKGDSHSITINGGTVIATSMNGGAGIGGGYDGNGFAITINGGTVTANGGENASGIGKGENGNDKGAIFVATTHIVKAGSTENPTDVIANNGGDLVFRLAGKRYVTVEPNSVSYVYPVYNDPDDVTKGVKEWETGTASPIEITSSDTPVTLGEAGKTTWYVVTGKDVTLSQGAICAGNVNLILADGAKLTATGIADYSDYPNYIFTPGIQVSGAGNSLAIYGQTAQSGQLEAKGWGNVAGIGGEEGCSGSNITINGGTVTATGEGGAGIGGGFHGSGSNITINGGTVTAIGKSGAGIGGGITGSSSDITINGGTVTATGEAGGAGIGGGAGGASSDIIINGGTVTANGAKGAAGIGGGLSESGTRITINGGTVTANGGENASGIGYGENGRDIGSIFVATTLIVKAGSTENPTDVIANNGGDLVVSLHGKQYVTVEPNSVSYVYPVYNDPDDVTKGVKEWETGTASPIEITSSDTPVTLGEAGKTTWYVVSGKDVTLSQGAICAGNVNLILADDAKLTANGTSGNAGITTDADLCNSLTIYGQTAQSGQLEANGGDYAAGIGGGDHSFGKNITINGGTVTANGGDGGAGIGGGDQGSGKNITINGGTVTANGGKDATGIGGGDLGDGEYITINGGTVTANGGENAAGIGGGYQGDGEYITINDGTVTANGGENAAGIGGGCGGYGAVIIVATNLIVKADGNNPPTTVIKNTGGDLAGSLRGNRYVTIEPNSATSFKVQATSADESKGTVSGGGIYEEGTEVTLTATPAEYYKFEKWSDGTTANPYVFTAEKDVELTASFSKIICTITVVSNDESYGTVSGGGTYEAGEEVKLFAISAEGYIFRNWSDGSTDEPYHFTATKDVSLTAIFEKAPWDFIENQIYYKVHGDEVGVVDADNIDIVIPETVTHNDKTYRVTSIEAEAFRGNEALHSVLIPNGVKEIGDAAFSGCNLLYKVILGADVEVIGDGAFTNCTTLGEMYFWRVTPPEGILQVDHSLHIFIPIISDSQEYEKFVVDAGPWGSHTIYNDIIVYKLQIWPKDAVVEIKGKRYGNGDIIGPFDGSLLIPRGTALQVSDVKDPGMFGYDLISVQIKDGEFFVNYASNGSIVFTDATPYGYANEKTFPELTYSRTFANTDWQALYVPFSMSYDEWKDDYDIARIHNFIEYDDDDNGEFDRTYLVVLKLTSGSTKPNTPYLIRAKSTGTCELYLGERTLHPAETNSLECSSTESTYTFTGTYTGVTDMYDKGYYAMSDGSLKAANSASVVLNPQRWYMVLTPKTSAPAATKAQSIQILVDGEEGIESLTPDPSPRGRGGESAYDLMGRSVSGAVKGISIVNGKKIIK